MTKPTKDESASDAMARHKAAMAQRKVALELMARQAAEKTAEPKRRRRRARGKKKAVPAERQLPVVRVSTSVRTVSGGLPSLGKRR